MYSSPTNSNSVAGIETSLVQYGSLPWAPLSPEKPLHVELPTHGMIVCLSLSCLPWYDAW